MPNALRALHDHTVLQCRSLDRLYFNGYIPELQRPEQVKRFLGREATRSPGRPSSAAAPRPS